MDPVEEYPFAQDLVKCPVSSENDSDNLECKPVLPTARASGDCCRNKCLESFDNGFKCRLKSDLSSLKRTEKLIYMFSMLSINEDVKNRSKGGTKSSKFFQYTVKEFGVPRLVCKTAFIVMHDTTPGMVRNMCNKLSSGYLIPSDERGKHEHQHTIPEHMKELIKLHFYETLKSPTIFKCIKKRFGHPNINQLWIDFKQKYGYLSLSTYSKYIRVVINPEVLNQFMSANEAIQILDCIKNYENKFK